MSTRPKQRIEALRSNVQAAIACLRGHSVVHRWSIESTRGAENLIVFDELAVIGPAELTAQGESLITCCDLTFHGGPSYPKDFSRWAETEVWT